MSEDTDKPENKTERVQLLMAPSEVAAIDDWGFKHRIRTRAEAIRRLCQMAIALHEEIPAMLGAVADSSSIINSTRQRLMEASRNDQSAEIISKMFNEYMNQLETQISTILFRVTSLGGSIQPLVNSKNTEDGMNEVSRVRALIKTLDATRLDDHIKLLEISGVAVPKEMRAAAIRRSTRNTAAGETDIEK